MSAFELASGQQNVWRLLSKLGEGDAGEVFMVEAVDSGVKAILKRPQMSVFSGDLFRQSTQIRNEAKIIQALGNVPGFDARIGVRIPYLLDQSIPGSEPNGQNFIVIQRAAGLDLDYLARIAQMGLAKSEEAIPGSSLEDRVLVDTIAHTGKIPRRLLLDVLYRLTLYLDFIHILKIQGGILWNDIKPGHLFWDTQRSVLTIIDWGNALFLDAASSTANRHFSWADDFNQLFEEMGRFLSLTAPELKERLDWPLPTSDETLLPDKVEALKSGLVAALQEEKCATAIVHAHARKEISPAELQTIRDLIPDYEKSPDFDHTDDYLTHFAIRLTQAERLDDLQKLCAWAGSRPDHEAEQWKLAGFLAKASTPMQGKERDLFREAIQKMLCKEWENALWLAATATLEVPEPDWWSDLALHIAKDSLESGHEILHPLVTVRRVSFTLQAIARDLKDKQTAEEGMPDDPVSKAQIERIQWLIGSLNDAIEGWTQLDPAPPDCTLEYKTVETLLADAFELIPEKHHSTLIFSGGPKAQVALVLKEWEKKNFLDAARGLRRLFVLDPDRRRVIRAEQAILCAPNWLKKFRPGRNPRIIFSNGSPRLNFRVESSPTMSVRPYGWS